MKNNIIENVVDEFLQGLDESPEFKRMFKAFIENKFSKNAGINDLKNLLTQMKVQEDE